jgi:hypothetical protein
MPLTKFEYRRAAVAYLKMVVIFPNISRMSVEERGRVQKILETEHVPEGGSTVVVCTMLILDTTEYTECWPCPLFDILLKKYFPAG